MSWGLDALRLVLHATFAWCAGAVFAVVWLWLFFGIQLDRRQSFTVVVLFGAMGLFFGVFQAWRGYRQATGASPGRQQGSPPTGA
ncbi:MAG: hypothetical protein J0H69_20400 [Burkholderiales bacterium]|nr:hypothetical protein [Burkholderiales bacterium]